MSSALGRLRDQLFKLTMELEFRCAQLTVMATANSLTSAMTNESQRSSGCRSPLIP